MMKRDRIENKARSSFIACVKCNDTGRVTSGKVTYHCTCSEGRHKAREAMPKAVSKSGAD